MARETTHDDPEFAHGFLEHLLNQPDADRLVMPTDMRNMIIQIATFSEREPTNNVIKDWFAQVPWRPIVQLIRDTEGAASCFDPWPEVRTGWPTLSASERERIVFDMINAGLDITEYSVPEPYEEETANLQDDGDEGDGALTVESAAEICYDEFIEPDTFPNDWAEDVPDEYLDRLNDASWTYRVAALIMCLEGLIREHYRYYLLKSAVERLVFGDQIDMALVNDLRTAMRRLNALQSSKGNEVLWAMQWYRDAADYEVSNPASLALLWTYWMNFYIEMYKALRRLEFETE